MDSADVRHAAYLTVHEFPPRRGLNSVESAGQVLNLAAGTVYNKANPHSDGQDFTLGEALVLVLSSKDFRILHAFAAACDHVAVSLGPFHSLSDQALLDLMTREIEAIGRKAQVMRDALEDGKIEPHEFRAIAKATHAQIRATLELMARLEQLTDAS